MHDDELDTELRRLFSDDRLSLPVAADAEQQVFAGISRRRKRRGAALAAAGAVLTVALVVGGVLVAPGGPGGGQDRADPPDQPPSLSISTSGSAAPTASGSNQRSTEQPPSSTGNDATTIPTEDGRGGNTPPGDGDFGGTFLPGRPSGPAPGGGPGFGAQGPTFGPEGFDGHAVGASQMTTPLPPTGAPPATPGTCDTTILSGGVRLTYDNRRLIRITNSSDRSIRTPEKIRLGDRRGRVEDAYTLQEQPGRSGSFTAPAGDDDNENIYLFTFTNNVLTTIVLQLASYSGRC